MTIQIEVLVSEEESDPDWDAFVAIVPCGHHVQTSKWGQVKGVLGYRAMRVIVCRDGIIVAGGQVLVKRITPFVTVGYLPKGPLLSCWDPVLGEILIAELKRIIQANHIILLAVQPPSEGPELNSVLITHGFRPSWLELAPTATILLDLMPELDQIQAQMKRQTRQNIRRSEREGMIVREGTEADLPIFYKLHLVTSLKQKFKPYPEDYFTRMWSVFSTQGLISLILAEYQGAPVSALLLVSFGNTVIAKTLGWSGQYAEHRPNDAVFWASIQWAKSHGYRCFDFEGINREGAEIIVGGQPLPEKLQHSPDFIKLGYGGKVALMPQSYYLVPSPLLRWPYHKIFGIKMPRPAIYEQLDRFRRHFG